MQRARGRIQRATRARLKSNLAGADSEFLRVDARKIPSERGKTK